MRERYSTAFWPNLVRRQYEGIVRSRGIDYEARAFECLKENFVGPARTVVSNVIAAEEQ